jgi:CHRD domain-containing protein/Big-like domain-containing protein
MCGGPYVACPLPTVSITAPAAGNVSGMVTLTATATASSQYSLTITSVQFFVDGTTSVGTVMASPYTVTWDSTKVANGSHTITAKATDSASGTATSAGVMVTVTNGAVAAAMSASQIFPAPMSQASGVARLLVDRETGAASGRVTLSGINARTVTINQGFAGSTGEALITLAPRANSAEWDVPANVQLTAEQMSALAQGRLYVIATSAAHPNGEIRGQLAPDNVRVSFSELTASPEAANRGMVGSGRAATTVDTSAGTLTVHVNTSGVDGAVAAQVTGSARLAALARDGVDTAHWSVELARVSAADVADFRAGKLSVSVASQAAPDGAIRGQIRPED